MTQTGSSPLSADLLLFLCFALRFTHCVAVCNSLGFKQQAVASTFAWTRTMAHRSAGVETGLDVVYCRHRPEDTPLYQIVERYNPLFEALRAEQGRALPAFVLCRSDVAHQQVTAVQNMASSILKRKENTLGLLGR